MSIHINEEEEEDNQLEETIKILIIGYQKQLFNNYFTPLSTDEKDNVNFYYKEKKLEYCEDKDNKKIINLNAFIISSQQKFRHWIKSLLIGSKGVVLVLDLENKEKSLEYIEECKRLFIDKEYPDGIPMILFIIDEQNQPNQQSEQEKEYYNKFCNENSIEKWFIIPTCQVATTTKKITNGLNFMIKIIMENIYSQIGSNLKSTEPPSFNSFKIESTTKSNSKNNNEFKRYNNYNNIHSIDNKSCIIC